VDAALERRATGIGRTWRKLTIADVVSAAEERSGMIVLVTLTTLASLIPLAVGTDESSLFGAIALATTGGTITGTLGAMLVVPAMVLGWGRLGRRGLAPAEENR
jgi:multidrug efflux pump subunit AcrB